MNGKEWQAFVNGLDAAIFRKPGNSNPYNGLKAKAWSEGHKKGCEVVTYHIAALQSKGGTNWFSNSPSK